MPTVIPPFYPNHEDNNHCLQTAIRIALGALNLPISLEEIDVITDYSPRYYSWTSKAVSALADQIPGIKLLSTLNYEVFAESGAEYLQSIWPPTWYQLQAKHSSPEFKREQAWAQELIEKRLFQHCSLNQVTLEALLSDHILITLVDAGQLSKRPYSVGHFMVLYDQIGNKFILHDPGLPPRPAWQVNKYHFMECFKQETIIIPYDSQRYH